MSSAASPSLSPSASSTDSLTGLSGGSSSSLYVYTFVIAIVVLGFISAALVVRAYIVRRRFRRRVAAALARGEPLPEVEWTGAARRRPAAELGPRPALWAAEMRREKGALGQGWDGVMPVSLTRAAPPPPPAPPARPKPTRLRDLIFTLRTPRDVPPVAPPAPADTAAPTTYAVPDAGTHVVLGVMIALPVPDVEERKWFPLDPEEAEVPEVVLGVMACRVGGLE
ncbi:hypothetical protein Q5752_000381 [Cryptotrichosporon argae]